MIRTHPNSAARPLVVALLLAILFSMPGGCCAFRDTDMLGNKRPEWLSTRGDIKSAKPDVQHIEILKLPIEDYPLLAKFTKLQQVDFKDNNCTDEKLEALSRIGFTDLAGMGIIDCPLVTDKGVGFLSRIPSLTMLNLMHCPLVTDKGIGFLSEIPFLTGLGLNGADITDVGMGTLATKFPHLTEIGVEGCGLLTTNGFTVLTNSTTIATVALSFDPFSQRQIENMITTVTNVNFWSINDPRHHVDRASLRQVGESRKVRIDVVDENKLATVLTVDGRRH